MTSNRRQRKFEFLVRFLKNPVTVFISKTGNLDATINLHWSEWFRVPEARLSDYFFDRILKGG